MEGVTMPDWKIIAGTMTVEQEGDRIYCDDEVQECLRAQGRTLFSSVSRVPILYYESKGDNDPTAAFLNAMGYLPGVKTVIGTRPPLPEMNISCIPDKKKKPQRQKLL